MWIDMDSQALSQPVDSFIPGTITVDSEVSKLASSPFQPTTDTKTPSEKTMTKSVTTNTLTSKTIPTNFVNDSFTKNTTLDSSTEVSTSSYSDVFTSVHQATTSKNERLSFVNATPASENDATNLRTVPEHLSTVSFSELSSRRTKPSVSYSREYLYTDSVTECLRENSFLHLQALALYMAYTPRSDDQEQLPKRPGRCIITIQGPPGRVISLVLLEQSCRPVWDLTLEVVDDLGKTMRKKSWDGCRRWMAPGMDFLSSGNEVTVNISVRSLRLPVARIRLHVLAVRPPVKSRLFLRYLTPFQGYLQSEGWDPSEEESEGKDISANVWVTIPLPRVAFISVQRLETGGRDDSDTPKRRCLGTGAILSLRTRLTSVSQQVWEACEQSPPDPPSVLLLSDPRPSRSAPVEAFHVRFWSWSVGRTRFRLLFSFHLPEFQPEQVNGSLWNCSVSFWHHFKRHLLCNMKMECAEGEDETGCPYQYCPPPYGGVSVEGTCYFTLPSIRSPELSWFDAQRACKEAGGEGTAIFASPRRWYLVTDWVLPAVEWRDAVFVGLWIPDLSRPHMYRYIPEWQDGTTAFFTRHKHKKRPPACAFFAWNVFQPRKTGIYFVHFDFCRGRRLHRSVSVLCQREETTEKTHGLHKPKPPGVVTLSTNVSQVLNVTHMQCPKGHVTHAFLARDSLTDCWTNEACALNVKGGAEVEGVCGRLMSAMLFRCGKLRQSVVYTLVCDHRQDCPNNSDEQFCVFPLCGLLEFACVNTQCIPLAKRCDRIVDCLDDSDELDCHYGVLHTELNTQIRRPEQPAIISLNGEGDFVSEPLFVDGDGTIRCPDTHFQCSENWHCLPVYLRCNGIMDCPSHEDEAECYDYTCPGFYRCRGIRGVCLHVDHVCDGWPQCPQHDDETHCNLTCPQSCVCQGLAFRCLQPFPAHQHTQLRYLDASESRLKPQRLEANMMLVFLSLAGCGIRYFHNVSLPNLRSLDLSDNDVAVFVPAAFRGLKNLQFLSLAGNPISDLSVHESSEKESIPRFSSLDLSRLNIRLLNVEGSFLSASLKTLNLSSSGVVQLLGKGFSSLSSLTLLDLQGCPMTYFPRDIFAGLNRLRYVHADKYSVCCPATLPDGFPLGNCQAPFDEVSSCDALLRSDIYRASLSLLSVLALIGNLGCFCARVFFLQNRTKSGYSVFVMHLSMSDFLMGVYLAMIGVVDRLYRGSYLWEEVHWRHSVACQVAGFSSFLSNEVSAFLVCLITLDRILVIRFPFSNFRFSQCSASITCVLLWTVGFFLAGVPLLPTTARWQFYSQTGICVPLPITHSDFAGHEYAFGIFIIVNFVIFLTIAIGQGLLYVTIARSSMALSDTSRKPQDLVIAQRLLVIVLSDFCCWFPIGMLGLLSSQGVSVPSEVNVAMAIFVLPLNSALNPFLYTLNALQERRHKAKERKLLDVILKANTATEKLG